MIMMMTNQNLWFEELKNEKWVCQMYKNIEKVKEHISYQWQSHQLSWHTMNLNWIQRRQQFISFEWQILAAVACVEMLFMQKI